MSYRFGPASRDDSLTRRTRALADDQLGSHKLPDWLLGALPSRRKRLAALAETLSGRVLQCPEPLGEMSWSHPFVHRPLVEFMMSLPSDIVCRPSQPRRLMRKALSGILPDEVRTRRSKGTYDGAFLSALRPLAVQLLGSVKKMNLVERGWVDAASLENRLKRLLDGLDCDEPQLRHLIMLEYWTRQRGRRSQATAAPCIAGPSRSAECGRSIAPSSDLRGINNGVFLS